MIVCGTNDNSLRECLLCENDLTICKSIYTGHAAEETRKHAHEVKRDHRSTETVLFRKISTPRN